MNVGRGVRGARRRTLAWFVVASVALVGLGPAGLAGAQDAGDLDEPPVAVVPVAVDDPLRPFQWNLDRIRIADAWEITSGTPEVVVAVIDTGVDPTHPDLAGAFWQDPATGSAGFDHLRGSFDTYVGRVQDWHGTAIAGIIAARAGDGYGMAGVAPRVSLMVHRIYESTSLTGPPGQATYGRASRAIREAAAAGADVILLSWGGTSPNAELVNAIEESGVPVVAAAGNDGQDLSGNPSPRRFPAMYRLPNLVTVAATDRDNQILVNERVASNYGARHVDIAAPGEDIIGTLAGGDHEIFEGTSFAAPQVAAALALGRALAPGVPASELVGTLVRTARRSAGLGDKVTSGGVLDVNAFLQAVERPVCRDDVPPITFEDVPRTSVHVRSVDCIAWHGVTIGTADGRFAPNRSITRGEMATFLTRVLDAAGEPAPADPPSPFTDVAGSVHARSIDRLAAAGIVSGTGGGRFEPNRPVTRSQMATFVVGTVEHLTGQPAEPARDWFDDVQGNTHERSILQARELGITLGTAEPREFAPSLAMTRAQMASFLARTLDALGRQGVTIERLP